MTIPEDYDYADIEDLLLTHTEDEDAERYIFGGEEYEDPGDAVEEALKLPGVNLNSDVVRAILRAQKEEVDLDSEKFEAIFKLYKGYSGADQMSWNGGLYDSKAEWAERETTDLFGKIPDHVIVDWEATADGMLMDYVGIELDGGRFAFFRR